MTESTQDDNPSAPAQLYEFGDPWLKVPKVEARFTDSNDQSRYIYNNNLHSTDLQVSVQLAGPDDNPLAEQSMPEDEVVFSKAKLIDYYTGEELGQGQTPYWSYGPMYDNPFTAPISISQVPSRVASGGRDVSVGSAASANRGAVGWRSIIYYIKCSENATIGGSYRFGIEITPTGKQIGSTEIMGKYGHPIAQVQPSKSVRFFAEGEPVIEEYQKVIITKKRINYEVGDLDVSSKAFGASNQDDKGPYYNDGTDDPDNFWRRWSYKISLNKNGEHNNYLLQWRLYNTPALPIDYCIKEIYSNCYIYKLYIWPINIYDDNGASISRDGGFHVESYNEGMRTININNDKKSIYIDWYAGFVVYGIDDSHNRSQKISFKIYDQYGNSGLFSTDTSLMPNLYDKDALRKWIMIQDGSIDDREYQYMQRARETTERKEQYYLNSDDLSTCGTFYITTNAFSHKDNDITYYLMVRDHSAEHFRKTWFRPKDNVNDDAYIVITGDCPPTIHPPDCQYMLTPKNILPGNSERLSLEWLVPPYGGIYDIDDDNDNGLFAGYIGVFKDKYHGYDVFWHKITPLWESGEVLIYSGENLHYYAPRANIAFRLHKLNKEDKRYRFKLIPIPASTDCDDA